VGGSLSTSKVKSFLDVGHIGWCLSSIQWGLKLFKGFSRKGLGSAPKRVLLDELEAPQNVERKARRLPRVSWDVALLKGWRPDQETYRTRTYTWGDMPLMTEREGFFRRHLELIS